MLEYNFPAIPICTGLSSFTRVAPDMPVGAPSSILLVPSGIPIAALGVIISNDYIASSGRSGPKASMDKSESSQTLISPSSENLNVPTPNSGTARLASIRQLPSFLSVNSSSTRNHPSPTNRAQENPGTVGIRAVADVVIMRESKNKKSAAMTAKIPSKNIEIENNFKRITIVYQKIRILSPLRLFVYPPDTS